MSIFKFKANDLKWTVIHDRTTYLIPVQLAPMVQFKATIDFHIRFWRIFNNSKPSDYFFSIRFLFHSSIPACFRQMYEFHSSFGWMVHLLGSLQTPFIAFELAICATIHHYVLILEMLDKRNSFFFALFFFVHDYVFFACATNEKVFILLIMKSKHWIAAEQQCTSVSRSVPSFNAHCFLSSKCLRLILNLMVK